MEWEKISANYISGKGGVKIGVATTENSMEPPQKKKKLKIELPYNPAITLLVI